jgi:DNA-directed RNA polymerase subunit L
MTSMHDELKRLAEKATPGPWQAIKGVEASDDMRCGISAMRGDIGYLVVTIENGAPGDFCDTEEANAALIVALVNNLPTILALSTENEKLKAAKWDVKHTSTMNDLAQMGMARDEAIASERKLRDALEAIKDDCQSTIDLYERNGPGFTNPETGMEYETASFVQEKMAEIIARAALATSNGLAGEVALAAKDDAAGLREVLGQCLELLEHLDPQEGDMEVSVQNVTERIQAALNGTQGDGE